MGRRNGNKLAADLHDPLHGWLQKGQIVIHSALQSEGGGVLQENEGSCSAEKKAAEIKERRRSQDAGHLGEGGGERGWILEKQF